MRVIVGLMLLVFFCAGLALIGQGLRMIGLRWQRRKQLLSAVGEVVQVERVAPRRRSGTGGRSKTYHFYPVVRFGTQDGTVVTFKAEIGRSARASPYRYGQHVPVVYDPAGLLPPVIGRGAGIWVAPLLLLGGGLGFWLGAGLIWLAFGPRIIGG